MATIPTNQIIKLRQNSAKRVNPTYTKIQFNNALQAAVDELLKASTANGLDNKMDASNPGFIFSADEKIAIRSLAYKEAARQT